MPIQSTGISEILLTSNQYEDMTLGEKPVNKNLL
jgi:hypothetical protein